MAEKAQQRLEHWPRFLLCAFPIHFWAIFLFILDAPRVQTTADIFDTFVLFGIIMIVAIIESIIFFLFISLLALVFPRSISTDKADAYVLFSILVISLWALAGQYLPTLQMPDSPTLVWLGTNLKNTAIYRQLFFLGIYGVIALTVILPALWIVRRGKAFTALPGIVERLTLLSGLYLFIDLLALVAVTLRFFHVI